MTQCKCFTDGRDLFILGGYLQIAILLLDRVEAGNECGDESVTNEAVVGKYRSLWLFLKWPQNGNIAIF